MLLCVPLTKFRIDLFDRASQVIGCSVHRIEMRFCSLGYSHFIPLKFCLDFHFAMEALMALQTRKAAAFQLPPKFNFLAGRCPPSRREWPLGHTPGEAHQIAKSDQVRGAK